MLRFGFALLLTIASVSAWANCEFKNAPTRLFDDNTKTVLVFSETISSEHWSPGKVDSPVFNQYKTWLQKHVSDLSQVALLKRQRAIYAGIPAPNDVRVFDAILNHELGLIIQPSCIESLLFTEHLLNVGAQAYAEFGARVLENSKTKTLKIYFVSSSEASVAFPKSVLTAMEVDIEAGSELKSVIHNHPFGLGNADIGGTDIGSSPDFETFQHDIQKYGLQNARITNGLDTILYIKRDVDLAIALRKS